MEEITNLYKELSNTIDNLFLKSQLKQIDTFYNLHYNDVKNSKWLETEIECKDYAKEKTLEEFDFEDLEETFDYDFKKYVNEK